MWKTRAYPMTTENEGLMTLLAELRTEEFRRILHWFRRGQRVLEIGGGNGCQASLIAATGAEVKSLDVAHVPPGTTAYFPVELYDGRSIPFPSASFDRVFSSNVLEHIVDLEDSLAETRRVLKDDGLAIHVLPTPSWRWWTSISYYPYLAKRAVSACSRMWADAKPPADQPAEMTDRALDETVTDAPTAARRSLLMRLLLAGPHGEYRSAAAELWYFSERRWRAVFEKCGFAVIDVEPTHLFYTGYAVFPSLALPVRRFLSYVLGSATNVFVLRKAS